MLKGWIVVLLQPHVVVGITVHSGESPSADPGMVIPVL